MDLLVAPPLPPPVGPPHESLSIAWLLRLLQEQGVLHAADLRRARRHFEGAGCVAQVEDPVLWLARLGLMDARHRRPLDEETIVMAMAQATGIPYLRIDPLQLDLSWVAGALSRPFALRHVVLPLSQTQAGLRVAVCDPFAAEVLQNIEQMARLPTLPTLACRSSILQVLRQAHGLKDSVAAALDDPRHDPLYNVEQLVRLGQGTGLAADDAPVISAVELLFGYAFDQRASDIHIEPRRESSQVRLRIDGILHDVHRLPRRVHSAILSRIKTLARLDIAERRRPQDGRIKTVRAQGAVELRVSTLPTAFGEKVVLRIFDPSTRHYDLTTLGMSAPDLATFSGWVAQPHGLVLVTGPTGSGKTTTLYASLQALADRAVNVTSVEDPIEMVIEAFNQVAVQPKAGLDFPQALRAILRQDPDVIMVGEIRDAATAQLAVQAALTGHLVLSTLHTDSAAHAAVRLQELGVPSYSVAAALRGVMAQRLLRRLCRRCRIPTAVAELRGLVELLQLSPAQKAQVAKTFMPGGCGACRHTGYSGRLGIFALLPQGEPKEAMPRPGAPLGDLVASALAAVVAGDTSLAELLRALGRNGAA